MSRKHEPSTARSSQSPKTSFIEPMRTNSIFPRSKTVSPSEKPVKPTYRPRFDDLESTRSGWLRLTSNDLAESRNAGDWKREDSMLPYLNSHLQREASSGVHPTGFSPFHPPTIPLPPIPLSPSTPTSVFDFGSITSSDPQMIENLDALKRSLPGPLPSAPLPPIPISPRKTDGRPSLFNSLDLATLPSRSTDPRLSSDDVNLPSAFPSRRPSSATSLISSTFRLSSFSVQSSATSLPSSDGLISSPPSISSFSRKRVSGGSFFTSLTRSLEETESAFDETSRAGSPTSLDKDSSDKKDIYDFTDSGSESEIDLNTSLSTFAMRSRIISPSSRLLMKKLRSSQLNESASRSLRRPSLPFLRPKPPIQKHRVSLGPTPSEMLSFEDGWMASDSEEEVISIFNPPSKSQDISKRSSLALEEPRPTAKKRLSAMELISAFPSPPTKPLVSLQEPKVSIPAFIWPEKSSNSVVTDSMNDAQWTHLDSQSPTAGSPPDLISLDYASKKITGQHPMDGPSPHGSPTTTLTSKLSRPLSSSSCLSSLSPIGGRSMSFYGGQALPLPRRMSDEDEAVWGEVEVAFHTLQQPAVSDSPVKSSFSEEQLCPETDALPSPIDKGRDAVSPSPLRTKDLVQQSNLASLGKELPQQSRLIRMRSNASLLPPGQKLPTPSIRRAISNVSLRTPVRPVAPRTPSSLPTKQKTAPGTTPSGEKAVPRVSPRLNTVPAKSPGSSTPAKGPPSPESAVPKLGSRIPVPGKAASTSKLPRRTNPKPTTPPSSFKWISS